MDLSQRKSRLLTPRVLLLCFSLISLVICAWAAAAHYRNLAWGDAWQPIGWLLSMFFLLCAFLPDPRGMATGFKSLIKPKTAFFLFWILFFVVSHLWNFRTAPWNGDALFDESVNDLGYLKSNVIGHPYQAARFHGVISRETLFHYYLWGFLKLFGFNILSYEAALFVIWLTAFVFALLLVDLFFRSYVVTSITALVLNFLPFAFIYTFVGYRYPMTVALAVVSLYFLHVGFKNGSPCCRSLGGIAAGLWNCFFAAQYWPRLLFPDFLPIPLAYYWFLVPGVVLAVWEKRYEVVLLATLPVVGVFVTGGPAVDQRLLLAIPFWIILMSFTLAALLKLRPWPGVQVVACALAALILLDGLVPSVRYIYSKTTSPFSISQYAQHQVAVSRFLRHVVAGQEHPGSPHLERDEFNQIKGILDPLYDTFICQNDAYSIIHLFLHDYDDDKILSFCAELPFSSVMTEQDVWNANKKAISTYVPGNKDLKLIWERKPQAERIIRMFQSLRDLGTEDSISFSFGGRVRTFYVLNIPAENIPQFQQRVTAFPATPELSTLRGDATDIFHGGKGFGKNAFNSPT